MPPPALRMPQRRDFFVEGVADRQFTKYRLYHRPSGVVVELKFRQDQQLPPFQEIVLRLTLEMRAVLAAYAEEPFYAPVA